MVQKYGILRRKQMMIIGIGNDIRRQSARKQMKDAIPNNVVRDKTGLQNSVLDDAKSAHTTEY
jgi:hypothetical protein